MSVGIGGPPECNATLPRTAWWFERGGNSLGKHLCTLPSNWIKLESTEKRRETKSQLHVAKKSVPPKSQGGLRNRRRESSLLIAKDGDTVKMDGN